MAHRYFLTEEVAEEWLRHAVLLAGSVISGQETCRIRRLTFCVFVSGREWHS